MLYRHCVIYEGANGKQIGKQITYTDTHACSDANLYAESRCVHSFDDPAHVRLQCVSHMRVTATAICTAVPLARCTCSSRANGRFGYGA